MKEFGPNTKAYYDAFTRILPCVVLEVIEPGNGKKLGGKLKIRVEKDTGPYKKGEIMEVSGFHTYPRTHRIVRGNQYRINTNYQWK